MKKRDKKLENEMEGVSKILKAGLMVAVGFILGAVFSGLIYGNGGRREDSPDSGKDEKIKVLEDRVSELESENEALKAAPNGFYQKLSSGRDVNVLIVGDSIGAGSGATDGAGWPDLLAKSFREDCHVKCNMENISMGGCTSYAGYVRTQLLDDGMNYDLAIICYGENDSRDSLSEEYEAIIRLLRAKYDRCSIISVLESSQKDYTPKIGIIQELANHYSIPVADTIKAFEDSSIPYDDLTVDGKHPNDSGHRLYFETIRDIIETHAESYEPYDDADYSPYNAGMAEYESFYEIPSDSFVRDGDSAFEIPVNGKLRGIPGIRHEFYPEGGSLAVYVDGELFQRLSLDWPYEFSQDSIYKISDEPMDASSSIRLEFSSKINADGFKGLVFTGLGE